MVPWERLGSHISPIVILREVCNFFFLLSCQWFTHHSCQFSVETCKITISDASPINMLSEKCENQQQIVHIF